MKQGSCHLGKGILFIFLFVGLIRPLYAQEHSPAHIGIIYPISTHGTLAAKYSNTISLHAISGVSGGEKGLALYGLIGVVKGNAIGLQQAGIGNLLKDTLTGVQMAGIFNTTKNGIMGWQLSGVFNQSTQDIHGQFAGVVNTAGHVHAVQMSGAVNNSHYLHGVQATGVFNRAERVHGVQVAGVANSAIDVQGTQIAGLMNRAQKVKGTQIAALLNIADSSDYPIGLINLVKNGEKRLGISTDEDLSTFLTFRSGGRVLYGILGVGMNPQYETLRYGLEGGIGAKLIARHRFRTDIEAISLVLTDFDSNHYNKSGFRLLPGYYLTPRLYLYGGPSIHYVTTDHPDGEDLVKISIWDRHGEREYQAVSAGFTAGLQWVL